jgi:hypothetical protein
MLIRGVPFPGSRYRPAALQCASETSSAFDVACEYPPWRVHFAEGALRPDGTLDTSVFPYWDGGGSQTFDNACPIVQSEYNCVTGGPDDYYPSVKYSNDEDNHWATSRGLGW